MARAKGSGAAGRSNAPLGTETYAFADDGLIPNSRLPLIVRRGAVPPDAKDPAAAFERVFVKNGWTGTWRDSIYDYPHYHSTAHEVLGVAEGSATVRFGGESGETVGLATGDVVVVPAGVSHALVNSGGDLVVVGAYADGREWDIVREDPKAIAAARGRIAAVPLPRADPVDGEWGPLTRLWS
jgi:uncharacterized protein YjlB